MKLISAIALSSLLGLVAAAPLNAKRALVWETKYQIEYETVVVMETHWLKPGEQAPKPTPANGSPAPPEPKKPEPEPPAPTPAPKPNQALEVAYQQPQPQQPKPSAPAPAPAPPAPAPAPPAPAPAPPAPAPAPYTPPAPVPAPAPAPQPAPAPAPKPSPPSSSGSYDHSGAMTFYSPNDGVGSCGWKDGVPNTWYHNTDDVVAMAIGMMGDKSLCGKMIKIHNPATGKTATGKIVDSCPGCYGAGIDLSPSLFDQLGDQAVGKYQNVEWSFA